MTGLYRGLPGGGEISGGSGRGQMQCLSGRPMPFRFRRGRGSRSFDRRTMLDSRVCFEKSPLPSFPTEVLPFSQPLPSLGADLWEENKAKSCQIAFGAGNRHYPSLKSQLNFLQTLQFSQVLSAESNQLKCNSCCDSKVTVSRTRFQ